MAPRGKMAGRRRAVRRLAAVLAALLLLVLLTGCARRCSFCGRRTIFFERAHLHGVELTICPECQYW